MLRIVQHVSSRIVVVEDDATIGSALHDALVAHGYLAEWCVDVRSATASIEAALPDLVLLDAGLPDVDGFTFCRWLRSSYADLPIILVTARDSDIDIVVGLDAGATDYVTKPFSLPVLLARVRAHLRSIPALDPDSPIVVGSMRIDPAAYQVTVDGELVALRPREFELLVFLARHVGKVVSRERILSEVWDLHWETPTKTLDMHMHALRRKLGDDSENPRYITTVRGVGYRFEGA